MTREEYDEWREDPVTQEFFHHVQACKEDLMKRWSQGMFTSSSLDETVQLNSHAIGEATALSLILESTYEDYHEQV